MTVALGAGILVPYKTKFLLGGELTWEYSKTLFGGVFYDPDGAAMPMPGVNIGLTVATSTRGSRRASTSRRRAG